MKFVIDIPEEVKNRLCFGITYQKDIQTICEALNNGTPLDKISAEIDRQEKWLLQAGYTAYNTDIAFDAIKAVLAERSE